MPQRRLRRPETLDDLRAMQTPEMRRDLRHAAPLVRQALGGAFPESLILPRSFCLGFAAH